MQQQQPPAPPNTTAAAAAAAEVAPASPKQARASAKTAGAGAGPQPGKCQFFLATKRRHCKFDATPGQQFCGNHVVEGTGVGPKRVMCPYGNHSVLESELKKHKAKCPTYRYWQAKQQQPCYLEDCNAGKGGDVQWPPGLQPLPPRPPAAAAATASAEGGKEQQASAKQQRPPPKAAAFAASMGKQQFMQLLHRIQTACDQVCEAEPLSVLTPPEAEPFLLPGSSTDNRPFSLKHAQQQASIVGNMQAGGLLEGAAGVTYVEYGAGKGYLSHMLSLCCPEVRKLVMVDVRGFQGKADRGMRHLEIQRLRCDIKDLDVGKVQSIAEGGEWVALGKHLCGAATDFTLRSCVQQHQALLARQRQEQQAAAPGQQQEQPQEGQQGESEQLQRREQLPAGGAGRVRGLAVATCCHHRCSWRHFVAQDLMQQLGFSPLEFELIAWMTGWALCGHEAPPGGGSQCGAAASHVQHGEEEEEEEEEKQEQEQQEEEHEACDCKTEDGEGSEEVVEGEAPPKRGRTDTAPSAASMPLPIAAPPAQHQTRHGEDEGQQAAACQRSGTVVGTGATNLQPASQQQQEAAGRPDSEWRPQAHLPRQQKVAVGTRCKQLIDAARLHWLRNQGFEATLLQYVPAAVSGENRLLLASARSAAVLPPPP